MLLVNMCISTDTLCAVFSAVCILVAFSPRQVAPQADQAISYTRRIREELAPPAVVARLIPEANLDREYSSDDLDKMNFKFISQPRGAEGVIGLDESAGIMRVQRVLDRETLCPMTEECVLQYDVVVGPSEYFEIIKVFFLIEDINDHSPQFIDSQVTLDIPESTIPGTTFTIPAAKDLDGGRFGINNYRLVADSGIFELKYKTIAPQITDLRVMLIDHLDREIRDRYELEVIAEDGGNPPNKGSLRIHVMIQDSNDNEPEFEKGSYEVSVGENIPINTLIMTVQAQDRDVGLNGQVRYSFAAETRREYGHIFDLDSLTGEIRVKSALDFEYSSIYLLSVTARDEGPGSLSSSTNVVVRLEDINDQPPVVVINTISPSGMPEIAENMPKGTFVAHLSVTDGDTGDGGRFECSIESEEFQVKKLSSDNEYQVVSAERFNRETRSVYEFPVTCRDFGRPPQTSITNVIVYVTDENDHRPIFSRAQYNVKVEENTPPGTIILQVNATDADIDSNAEIRYHIGGVLNDMFLIDGRTGVVTSTVLLDHERLPELEFQVFAVDQGEPALTATSTVVLSITDQNDEAPTCDKKNYDFYVEENLNPGTPVGKVSANDRDSHPHNEFLFSLRDSNHPSSAFSIDPHTGVISTSKVLDRESHAWYDLIVLVTATGNVHTSFCQAKIHVLDKNDNPPEFRFPMEPRDDTIYISNKIPKGYKIGTLKASDRDSGQNAQLMFAIIAGNEEKIFGIDPSTGRIFLYSDISHRDKVTYSLRVEVKDMGEPELSNSARLYVAVDSSAAHPPARKDRVADASLMESQELTIVLGITAGIILVLICIALVVIFCCCTRRSSSERALTEEDKETQQRMLHATMEDELRKPCEITRENGVMVVDIANPNYSSPAKNNGIYNTCRASHPAHHKHESSRNGGHHSSTLPRERLSRPPDKSMTPPLQNGYTHGVNSLKHTVHGSSPRPTHSNHTNPRNSSHSGEFISFGHVDNDV